MDHNTNQFRLSQLSSVPTPSRPTIPYSQFPRPTLENPEAIFPRRHSSETEEDSSDTADEDDSQVSQSGLSDMEGGGSPAHRRGGSRSQDRGLAPPSRKQRREHLDDGTWAEEASGSDIKSNSDDIELDDESDFDGLQDDEETGLTGQAKGKRRRRKGRNTHLDQRVVTDEEITPEEKKEADQNVLKRMLINGLLIALW
jgi:solute carrier family 35 protein C2